jgi:uncharacterized protein involved in exopolysaccharide biosynthesis
MNWDTAPQEIADLREQLAATTTLLESHRQQYADKCLELIALRRQVEELSQGHFAQIQLEGQLAASQQALRNVYEVWAGSEGIPVLETVVEAYLLRLVEKMRDAAKEGLK